MSKNTYLGANVISTDTFAGWIDKTNQVRDDMGRIVVTVTTSANAEPNTSNAGLTTGNLAIQGVVTANTIAVSSALRGGTVTTPGNLTISSNVLFTTTGNVEFTAADNINLDANNLILSSNVIFDGGITKSIRIDTANTTVNTGSFFVNSNTVFNSNVLITGANTTIGDAGTDVFNNLATSVHSANALFSGALVNITSANTTIGDAGTDVLNVNSISDFNANVNIDGILTVTGNAILSGTNTTIGDAGTDILNVVATPIFTSNTLFSGALVNITSANTTIGDAGSDKLNVVAAPTFTSNAIFTSNVSVTGSNTVLSGTVTVGNLVVTGVTSLASNVSFFVNTATANTSTVYVLFNSQGNTIIGDSGLDRLDVNANTLFSSNVTISGTTTVGSLIANSKAIAVGGNITTANNFTITGNFPLTLTQTDTTNVTLPVSGTLATLTGSETLTNKTFVTPVLGAAAATSINKVIITSPAIGATLTIADGKTATVSNSLTFSGTDGSSILLGTGGTVLYTSNKLNAHASTTSAELASVISDETGSGLLVFNTAPTISDAVLNGNTSIGGNMIVTGNLTINGTTTTINSTTISVDDKNIELGSITSPTDLTADGGGITLKGTTDKTINWVNASDSWTSSENFDLLTGKTYNINGAQVLSSTALGSGVVSSSLTSVGTITSGTWNASTITTNRGGTGQTTYTDGQLLIGSTASGSLSKATLTAGQNITITNGGGSITIAAASAPIPDLSYTSSTASGTVNISGGGTSATIPAATASIAGLVTTGTQTIAGIKTFNNGTASSSTTTGTVVITGGLGVSGAINAGSDITAYATSDVRLKKNIKAIPDALEKVMQISGVTYNWNDIAHEVENKDMSVNEVGVIAQEINDILPEVITTRDNGYMAVRYEKIVPLLIEAIKELNDQVKSLKSELESK